MKKRNRTKHCFKSLFSDWRRAHVSHGISTIRSLPSPYLPKLKEFDNIKRNYWRDVADRKSMRDRLNSFLTPLKSNVLPNYLKKAIEDVRAVVGRDFLKPISLPDAVASLPGSSGCGLPYYGKRSEFRNEILRDARLLKRSISLRKAKVYPCVAAARRVIRPKGKNKPRLVWAYPGAVSALEQKFAFPIGCKTKRWTWHGSQLQWMSGKVWQSKVMIDGDHQIITCDFSSFDTTVSSRLIRAAFSILRDQFVLTKSEERQFNFIVNYFIHTPIAFYGDVIQKHRGIPSGSCFTSIIGSIVNMIVCQYCALRGEFLINFKTSYWLGDDSRLKISSFRPRFDYELKKLFIDGSAELGMTVSDISCNNVSIQNDCLGGFLSREMFMSYPQLRFDKVKCVAQLLIPEQKDKSPNDTINRIIGLTYAYGYDKEMYALLSRCYTYVRETHGGKPEYTERVALKTARYIQDALGEEDWRMPSFERVHFLYFGYF